MRFIINTFYETHLKTRVEATVHKCIGMRTERKVRFNPLIGETALRELCELLQA